MSMSSSLKLPTLTPLPVVVLLLWEVVVRLPWLLLQQLPLR
jgi:hypothetical protein